MARCKHRAEYEGNEREGRLGNHHFTSASSQRLLANRWVLPNPEEDVVMFSAGLPVSLTVAFTDPAHPVARMVYSVRLRLEADLEESRSQSFVMT